MQQWIINPLTPRTERQSARMSKITNEQLNPAWHRMLYSCTHVAPQGIKGLTSMIVFGSVCLCDEVDGMKKGADSTGELMHI